MRVKTLPALTEKAQKVFNTYIRKRDEGMPCISCGKPGNQAGHYFSVKQFNALRFDTDNVHLQCAGCNKYLHGNQAMYRIGLVNRIGAERVEKLEARAIKHRIWKWSPTELEEIIKKYK